MLVRTFYFVSCICEHASETEQLFFTRMARTIAIAIP